MNIFTVSTLAIVVVLLILVVKDLRQDFVIYIICTFTVIILYYLTEPIKETIYTFSDIANKAGLSSDILTPTIKIIGMTFIAEFTSSICNDAGISSIGNKIEMFTKIVILTLTLPVITSMLNSILSIFNEI